MKTALALAAILLSILSCEAGLSPECSWGPSYWCQSKLTASQCGQEAYCNNQVWKDKGIATANVGSVQCDVCKILIGYVQQYINNNSTESQAEAAIEEVCSKLGPLKDECDAVVQGYFPQIWQLLVSQADPDKVCAEVGLCSSALKATAKVESIVGSVQCDVCKLVINFVQQQLDKNSTEAEAKAEVEKLCSALGSLKSECNTLVDSFFDRIWQLLVDRVDPTTVCSEIQLCSSAQLAKITAVQVKSVQCDVCKIAARFLQQFADKNTTEAEVQKELEQLCNVLGSLKDECETLLTDFFPEFWNAIVNKLDPSSVCASIGLCSSASKAAELPKPTVLQVKVDGCDICKKVVEALQTLLLSNTTEDMAEKEVKKVCFFLGPLDDECKTMIDTYFPQMWQLLQEELSPDQVCAELKLCTSSSVKVVQAVPKVAQTAQCDVCKIIALYLNKFVANNGTETEAKDAVKNICHLLGSISSECNTVVDMFFDQIWQMVIAETEPDTICDMLKLCTNTALKAPKQKISVPKQSFCDVCELLVNFIKPYVDSNSTENEVKDALEQLCNALPSTYKTQCTDFIDQYLNIIWTLVKSEFDNDLICKQIGVCNSTLSTLKLPVSKPKPSLPKQTSCDVCKLAVTFLQQYVDSNSTENEVKQALENLCGILPSGFKDECTSLIDSNFGTIWLLVKSEFDNDLICKQIGLCNATVTLTKQPVIMRAKPKLAMPKQNLCDMCKLAVTFIKPYVDSNSTEKEVEDALDEVCSLLPANNSKQCTTFLDTFFPLIWEKLKNEVDTNEICKQLNLCNSTSASKMSLAVSKPKTESGPLCTVCTMVSAFIRQFVDNKSTKADAEKAVSELCTKLPSPYNSTCSSLIDTYFDMIWNLIDSYVDDDDLCKQLNLCNDTAAVIMKEDASGPLCVICEFVMKELESMIDSNTTEAEIQAALDKVCSLLPSSITKDCNDFVDTYGKDIIKLLLEAVSPRLVCTALHLCAASTQEKTIVVPVVEKVDLKDECSTCKLVLGFVKTLVEDYQKPVEDALEDVCNLMPSAIRSECTVFVKEFAPAIIQLVDQEIDPDTICKDLKLCTQQQQRESALVAPWKKLARAKSF